MGDDGQRHKPKAMSLRTTVQCEESQKSVGNQTVFRICISLSICTVPSVGHGRKDGYEFIIRALAAPADELRDPYIMRISNMRLCVQETHLKPAYYFVPYILNRSLACR